MARKFRLRAVAVPNLEATVADVNVAARDPFSSIALLGSVNRGWSAHWGGWLGVRGSDKHCGG
ncbi:MAG: hypothetical protein HN720_03005 [Nitrospinaceae bacterium]|nr:hypothetical protein [Nitrospinaceae bacterium]MBT7855872.1 hypothetical protein [Nitrospinaceae bacterium]